MNGRERFSRALQLIGSPDTVPVAPPFQTPWALDAFGVSIPRAVKEPKKAAAAIVKAQTECPFDAIEIVWDWFAFLDLLGCTSMITKSGTSVIQNALKSWDEVAKLALVDTSSSARVQSSLVTAEAILEELGEEVFCLPTIAGPFTLAGHLCGLDALMRGLFKHPAEAHQLLDYSTQTILRHMRLYAALGVHGFFVCEPSASGNLISPRHFEEFVVPYTSRVIVELKRIGMPPILHICGNTTRVLPFVASMAPTAFSFDSVVDVAVVKAAIGDSICLLGNVNPTDMMLSTPEDVRDESRQCIAKGSEGGGYVLGAGCELCAGTPVENIRALIAAGHEAEYR